jgi:hypothetical protein
MRWSMLAILFIVRLAMGYQFQSISSVSTQLVDTFGFSYTQVGTLIGLVLLPGVFMALPSGAMTRAATDKTLLMIGAAFYNVLVDLISLRRQHALDDRSKAIAPSLEVSDGSQWKTPLAVGTLGVSYVLGLTFVGFFVSTFCFTLLTMVCLHHFERRAGLTRKALTLYLPLSVAIVAVLYAGIRALRIYVPTQAWLW